MLNTKYCWVDNVIHATMTSVNGSSAFTFFYQLLSYSIPYTVVNMSGRYDGMNQEIPPKPLITKGFSKC